MKFKLDEQHFNELGRRIKKGDEKAFNEFAEDIYEVLWTVLFRYVGENNNDASCAVQESLLKIWRVSDSYDSSRPFLPWVFKLSKNTAISMMKANKYKPAAQSLDNSMRDYLSLDPEDSVDEGLMRTAVRGAINKLSEREQQLLNLRYFEDLSIGEIALETKMNPSTVKVAVHRARHKLRDLLS